MALQTEFGFTLPKGYVDRQGQLHRRGRMRLATARDEIEPLRDPRIDGPDDPYLTVLVLARVITELGSLPRLGPEEVEGLFAADIAFLQDLYGIVNFGDPRDVEALQRSVLFYEEGGGTDAGGTGSVDELDDDAEQDAATDEDEPAPDAVAPLRRRDRIEELTRVVRS